MQYMMPLLRQRQHCNLSGAALGCCGGDGDAQSVGSPAAPEAELMGANVVLGDSQCGLLGGQRGLSRVKIPTVACAHRGLCLVCGSRVVG